MKIKQIAAFALSLLMTVATLTGCGQNKTEIENFENYVSDVAQITIPEDIRIVALGEAAHGNKEFQELKLEVFKTLVKNSNVRGLILEGDFGGCAIANKYIQGGEGTAEEVTKLLGYRVYRTDEMCALIQWMHDYNETADEDDMVRLYGADIQSCTGNIRLINEYYQTVNNAKAPELEGQFIDNFGTEEDMYNPEKFDEVISFIETVGEDLDANKEAYISASSVEEFESVRLAVDVLAYYMEYREKENFSSYYRDSHMKVIVDWALNMEEREHSSKLMLACHNGHMTKNQSSNYTFLGKQLYEEYGDEYFAIGTDFYITQNNMPDNNGGRIIKEFCSDDILAMQLDDMEKNIYYLEFANIDKGSKLYGAVTSKMSTGSLGEQYTPLMDYMKSTYQINFAPTDMYDAMILVYEATPTKIWDK